MEKLREGIRRFAADLKEYRYALAGLAAYDLLTRIMGVPFCPMRSITGFPCAGCGLTRAAVFLAGGKLSEAADINPMIFPVLVFLLYCGYFRYVRGERIRGLWAALGILTACMLIFYGIRMYLYFPDRVPYVYTGGSLLEKRLPWYPEWVRKLTGG